jgi:hypothetical protein
LPPAPGRPVGAPGFPGFTNFAADYRSSALFWEMHVGGAAGCLAVP